MTMCVPSDALCVPSDALCVPSDAAVAVNARAWEGRGIPVLTQFYPSVGERIFNSFSEGAGALTRRIRWKEAS